MKRWHALLLWFFGTLLAIAFIGDNLLLGFALAVASGIAFGVVNYLASSGRTDRGRG